MTEKSSTEAAELLEGSHIFSLATIEGTLDESDENRVCKGKGQAQLLRYDRSRDPRGLFLQLKLADGRTLSLVFETWDRRKSRGQVELILLPETI